jgi:translocation and assembly module TamB
LLTIEEGSVVFTGASRIDPLLNVKATTRIERVVITVTVGGTLSRPEINLASLPVMDESDIIAYLLFGRPSARLSESEGSVLETTTVNVLGDIAAKGLKSVIGRELSPDIINVGAGGQEVGVGKYINSRLFVQYEWRLGTQDISETFIDYQLSDRFTLHSQVGYEPTEGVDLLWRINY